MLLSRFSHLLGWCKYVPTLYKFEIAVHYGGSVVLVEAKLKFPTHAVAFTTSVLHLECKERKVLSTPGHKGLFGKLEHTVSSTHFCSLNSETAQQDDVRMWLE